MRTTHLGVGAAVAIGALALVGGPAGADVVTPPGACTASATWTTGLEEGGPFTVDTANLQPTDVITVPRRDTVTYTATANGVAPGERQVSGRVSVRLPWPLPEITIDSWDGTATEATASGQKTYDLPSFTPRNVELEIRGVHRENGVEFCSGTVKAKLEGRPLDSPITYGAIAGTALTGIGLLAAGRPKWKRLA